MPKVIIFGASGQDGQFLADLLLRKGFEVLGVSRSKPDSHNPLKLIRPQYTFCDITRFQDVSRIVELYKPDSIYNLAAESSVSKSFSDPIQCLESNTLGAINVLNSVRDAAIAGRSIRLFQASSSEMFGSSDLALNEFSAMKPHSPYAVSKYVIHSLANRYRENFELQIACGIMFNHESELRPEIFVTQKIIRNLVRLKRGEIDTFELGNIEISRDWGYAPEFVEAMYLITENGVSEDFVIGTGVPHTLREFIQAAIDVLGLACVTDDVIKINPSLYRQSDIAMTFADPRKIFDRFAWRAQLDLYGLVEKLCNYQLLL